MWSIVLLSFALVLAVDPVKSIIIAPTPRRVNVQNSNILRTYGGEYLGDEDEPFKAVPHYGEASISYGYMAGDIHHQYDHDLYDDDDNKHDTRGKIKHEAAFKFMTDSPGPRTNTHKRSQKSNVHQVFPNRAMVKTPKNMHREKVYDPYRP